MTTTQGEVSGGEKILVVEDDAVLGGIITAKLIGAGYNTELVTDGEKGLETIRTFNPDLILLDIVLPLMNGYELLEQKQKDPAIQTIPVIIISNSGQPVEISRTLALGARDYLVKANFSPDEVLTKVREQLARGSAATKSLEGIKVMVVEDDPFLKDLLGIKLVKEGCVLLSAQDGDQAFEMAVKEQPAIILLDLLLPSTHGFEVLKRLKGDPQTEKIPVMILSNLGQESDLAEGKKLGAVDFLIKSNFNTAEVVAKIKSLL